MSHRTSLYAFALLLPLCACSASQVERAQVDAAKVASGIQTGCADALAVEQQANAFGASLVPQASAIEVYINASCVGGAAVAALTQKALNDPNTVTWLENLSTQLKAVSPKKS